MISGNLDDVEHQTNYMKPMSRSIVTVPDYHTKSSSTTADKDAISDRRSPIV